jgi:hypothetical protein
MLLEGQRFYTVAPRLVLAPGIMIFLARLNLLGEGARCADPHETEFASAAPSAAARGAAHRTRAGGATGARGRSCARPFTAGAGSTPPPRSTRRPAPSVPRLRRPALTTTRANRPGAGRAHRPVTRRQALRLSAATRVTFHDGTELTAADVKRSMGRRSTSRRPAPCRLLRTHRRLHAYHDSKAEAHGVKVDGDYWISTS